MKWSEQMRVLQSEDEHYNQLIYDEKENALYINEECIALLDENNCLDQNTFWDLKKKYPYIDDKNFLLNCLFKIQTENGNITSPYYERVTTCYFHPSYVEYPENEHVETGNYIFVYLSIIDSVYNFTFIKKGPIKPPSPL